MAKDKKTKLIEELIAAPDQAAGKAEELRKFGLDASRVAASVKIAKAILEDPDAPDRPKEFAGLDYAVKLTLLDRLAEEGAGAFLARLQRDEKDKGTAKAIARAIHNVRAQGMSVADMREKKSVKFDFTSEGMPDSYVSPLDTEGNRLVLLARVTSTGRMNVFHVVVGDTNGMSNFEGIALTRAQYRRFVAMAEQQMGVKLAVVPGDYAAWAITEGARTAVSNGLPTPPAYEQAKQSIEPPASAPPHPLDSMLDVAAVKKDADKLAAESGKLHTFAECAFWVPDEPTLEKLEAKLKEADESKVAVTPAQKQDLKLRAAREVAKEYFDDAKRTLWENRLRETALVLAGTGRLDDAKLALGTAIALGKKGSDVEKIPFAMELTEKIVKNADTLDPHAGHSHAPGEGHDVREAMAAAAKSAPEESASPIVKP